MPQEETLDPNEFEQFMQMDPEQMDAFLAQAQGAAEDGAPATEPANQAAAQPTAPEAQGMQEEVPVEGQDNRKVPYGALHEERMKRQEEARMRADAERKAQEMAQRLADIEARMNQGQAYETDDEGGEQSGVPELTIEDPDAIAYYAQQAVAPYLQTIKQLQDMLAESQQQAMLQQMSQQYNDPDLPRILAEFDAQVPEIAAQGVPPAARYFMAVGIQSRNPAAQAQQQQVVSEQARQMAVQQQAQRLSQGARQQQPPTLAGIPPAAANLPQGDLSQLSMKQFMALDPATEERLLRGELG